MNRRMAVWLLCGLFALPVAAQVQPAAATEPITGPTLPPVTLMMAATDKAGQAITGLTKEQVMVFDNGQPASTLEVKGTGDLPLHLGIVLLAQKSNFEQQQVAAAELIQKLVRPGVDKAFVVTALPAQGKGWPYPRLEWYTEPQELVAFVKGLEKGAGIRDAYQFDISQFGAQNYRFAVQTHNESDFTVFEALWAMFTTDRRPARRVLVMFRSPWAHGVGWYQRAGREVDERTERFIANAQGLGISLYAIAVQEPTPVPRNLGQTYTPTFAGQGSGARRYDEEFGKELDMIERGGRANLERLAVEGGGRVYWKAKKNYTDAVAGLMNELNGQYAVTFSPNTLMPTSGPGRPLRVGLKGKDALLSFPRAYYAPGTATGQIPAK